MVSRIRPGKCHRERSLSASALLSLPLSRVISNVILALMLPSPKMSILTLACPSRSCSCSYKSSHAHRNSRLVSSAQSCLFREPGPNP